MIIIAGKSNISLAQKISYNLNAPLIISNTKKFEDSELRIQFEANLDNKDVIILQSTSKPVNDHLIELLLIADAIKFARARNIIALMPYFGYSRQDRPLLNNSSASISLIAKLIETSGINTIITIDLHSKKCEEFFKIKIVNLESFSLFVPLFKLFKNSIVISPDHGGLQRAQRFANALGIKLAVISKRRDQNGQCEMIDIKGDVADKNCIIIDDIIDTGETIYKAAKLLFEKKAKSVSACITHAVLSSKALNYIAAIPFDRFYVTDTIVQSNLPDNIKVISANPLIVKAFNDFEN